MPDDSAAAYRIIDRNPGARADDRAGVVAALIADPARVSPKYFYDELGCALYGAICRLPEYYPTRTEMAIFREERGAIAAAVGSGRQFVDLGAGDCCKAEGWLTFLAPSRYIAVDIAGHEIANALDRMAPDFPGVEMIGVVDDFSRGLDLEGILDSRPVTFFYPGSSIGNFTPDEALSFVASIRAHCATRPGSGLLIGVDAKKQKGILDAAYDDALGVTAAFNRNVLLHLNRRFGFDFQLHGFEHKGFYNEAQGRIEHLGQMGRHARSESRGEVVRIDVSKRRRLERRGPCPHQRVFGRGCGRHREWAPSVRARLLSRI